MRSVTERKEYAFAKLQEAWKVSDEAGLQKQKEQAQKLMDSMGK
jgi:hypothetical protein